MKKKLILLFLTISLCQAYSQELNIGFGFGLNYSDLVLKNVPEHSSIYKLGFHCSTLMECKFNNYLALSIEPGFSSRGSILRYTDYPDTKVHLNYLVLPTTIKYFITEKISINIGPELSWRLSAKGKTENNITDLSSLYDSNFDIGVVAGLSYRLFDNVEIAFRYNRGFISVIKDLMFVDEEGMITDTGSLVNQGFSFSAAYLIK